MHNAFPSESNHFFFDMTTPAKPQGPASYFPSIEKKYGLPIAHWISLVEKQSSFKHMEQVTWLKTEHGMGHGHANAIVAYVKANSPSSIRDC